MVSKSSFWIAEQFDLLSFSLEYRTFNLSSEKHYSQVVEGSISAMHIVIKCNQKACKQGVYFSETQSVPMLWRTNKYIL